MELNSKKTQKRSPGSGVKASLCQSCYFSSVMNPHVDTWPQEWVNPDLYLTFVLTHWPQRENEGQHLHCSIDSTLVKRDINFQPTQLRLQHPQGDLFPKPITLLQMSTILDSNVFFSSASGGRLSNAQFSVQSAISSLPGKSPPCNISTVASLASLHLVK